MTCRLRRTSGQRGASLAVTVIYAVMIVFLAGGFIYLGNEMRRQHAIWDNIRLLQTAETDAEVSRIGAELARRQALLFLVKALDRPAEDLPAIRVCTGFGRIFTGEFGPMSGAQRKALARLSETWAEGDKIERSIASKVDAFLEKEAVSFTEEEKAHIDAECRARRQAYAAWQRRVVLIAQDIVRDRYARGKPLPTVMIGEISRLLIHTDDETRRVVGDILIEIGKPSAKWLRKWLERESINPVFRVETAEMTEDEKAEQLLRQDTVAKREALRALRAIGTPEAQAAILEAKTKPALAWLFGEESPGNVR